ncbi:MAG: hypothetical protein WDO18_21745 [Acidobacteriota bacterium]
MPRVGHNKKKDISATGKAPEVLKKIMKLVAKPGIDRDSVFQTNLHQPVYAYSVFVEDPTKLVREDVSGTKVVGRVVGGHFRPVKSK